MSKFLYKAKGPNGRTVTGTVEAKNEIEAEALLTQHSLVAEEVVAVNESPLDFLRNIFSRINDKDRAIFARQLSTMVSAGLTLPKSIKVTSNQARTEKLRNIYMDLYKQLEEGKTFSSALRDHPEAFNDVYVAVVAAGEQTGKVDVVLKQLATQLENNNNFVGRVRGALYYPGFIIVAMVAIAIYMLVKVIPALKGIFDQEGEQLPIATRILLAMSDAVQVYWWAVIMVIIGRVIFLRFFFESQSGAAVKDKLAIKTPVIKKMFEGMYMYRVTEIMAMLLGAGVPLLNTIKIAATTVNNGVYEESLLNVAKYVERGVPLSVQLMKEPVFPPIFGQMASVGEETGQLDKVLKKVSDYYQETTDQMIKTLSTLIEPAILLLVGAAVAFIVFAVLVPIYNIAQIE
jgi:type IV pilus assembly protein PilC